MQNNAPSLKVNLDDAFRYVSTICRDSPATFQWFDDTHVKDKRKAGQETGDFDAMAEKLTTLNDNKSGIFLMFNEGNGQGRSTENVVRVRGFCVDADGSPLEPVLRAPMEPHIVTETSAGRFQVIWLVDGCPLEKFEPIQKALAARYGSDPSVHDLPRVFRVPGFFHNKYDPFQSRLITCDDLSKPYSFEEFVSVMNLNTEIQVVERDEKKRLTPLSELLQNPVPESKRHATQLAYASFYAHQFNLDFDAILAIVQRIDREGCNPPKNNYVEQCQIVKDAINYAVEARNKNSDIDVSELIKKHTVNILGQKRSISPLPEHILRPPGLVGDVMEYILATSTKPQPELALAASLCAVGALVGRKVKSPTNLRTNIYCISLIETGAGKDWPRQAVKLIFEAAEVPWRAKVEELASDAAISENLAAHPSQVFLLDELGKFLQLVSAKNAPTHLTSILTTLIKAFSSAGYHWYAKSYADSKFDREVQHPNLCILGTAVEDNFYKSMTTEAVMDGLLNRMLIFRSNDAEPKIREVHDTTVPQHLINSFRAWEDIPYRTGGGDLSNIETQAPIPRVVPYFGKAGEIFSDFESDLRSLRIQLRADGSNMASLFTRAREHAIKIALILAAGQNPIQPMITQEEACYGCTMADIQTRNLLEMVRRHVADSKVEESKNMITEFLRRRGAKGATMSEFARELRSIKSRERTELLTDLEMAGEIHKNVDVKPQGAGPSVTRYFFSNTSLTEN